MAMGKRKSGQAPMWIATTELPGSPGHPFYVRLNEILDAAGFDRFWEGERRARACGARPDRTAGVPGPPVLRATERDPRRRGLRPVRRRAMPAVLRSGDGPTQPRPRPVLPLVAGRLFRRPGLGARDRLASSRLAG